MKIVWPEKAPREELEICGFIGAYVSLPHGRSFEVDEKHEKPDYWLRDCSTGETFGVELTSVYLDDRSVPDEHMRDVEGAVNIPDDVVALKKHMERLVTAVADKVHKATIGYDLTHPLLLSVRMNEYISLYLTEETMNRTIISNPAVFDNLDPFSEVLFWTPSKRLVVSVMPSIAEQAAHVERA